MKVYGPNDPELPGFAKHSSTFKNDERCTEVWFIVGDDEDEVWQVTEDIFDKKPNDYIDRDVNKSTEGDCYVGVVCKDL